MTFHRATNWLLALAVVALYALVQNLDGPQDWQAEQAQAVSLADLAKEDAAEQRFASAAQSLCGPNAAWQRLDDATVQCLTKKGRKTIKATL